MEKRDFSKAINEIFEYFRFKTIPSGSVVERWFDKTSFIPAVALPWITDKIEDGDTLPRNLPKLFQSLWYQYRRENPEMTTIRRTECDDCGKMGFWFVEYLSSLYYPAMKIQKIIICASCDNARIAFGGNAIALADRMTKDELLANEYEILDHDRTYQGRQLCDDVMRLDRAASVAQLAHGVGGHLNPGERKIGNIPTDEIPF
jgi:hypothetical protein